MKALLTTRFDIVERAEHPTRVVVYRCAVDFGIGSLMKYDSAGDRARVVVDHSAGLQAAVEAHPEYGPGSYTVIGGDDVG